MPHIAMFSVGAHGHVNPNLPVIAELVARGHRVSYAVPESFAQIVASADAVPVVYRSVLRAAFDRDRPAVVLYDIAAYAARVLAHSWEIPLVQLSPAMVAWEGYEQDMAEVYAAILDNAAGQAYQSRFAAWLDEQDIALSVDDFIGRPPWCIVLIPRALQPHAEKVDERVYTFVGPSLNDRPHQGDWPQDDWSPPDRPLLLVSLGSAYTDAPQFYRDCFTAFGGLDWQVVMSIGRHVDRATLGPVPSNVELHEWVPQLAVLGRATPSRHHGQLPQIARW